MSSSLSAADKVTHDQLAGAQDAAMAAVDRHQAGCDSCTPGRDWHKRACPAGWDLVKAAHQAAMAYRDWLRRGQLAEHDGQLRLW